MPTPIPSPYRPIPGPADRVTFFTMQRRHRKASWRFSVVSAIAVLLTGLPLSIIVTPLLYAIVLVVAAVANAADPTLIPARWWTALHDVPLLLPHTIALLNGKTHQVPLRELLIISGVLVAPGAVILLGFWVMVRLVFRRAGVGGVLLALGARDPNLNDIEERQLMNLTEEMAIAAGVPPPRVMLIDGAAADGAANAAAVGWSIEDATIVVTRPLLDGLGRDETQAVIGQLIGSVGNGDLKIALVILSLFQAVGLVSLLLNALFGFQAWRTLFRFARLALLPHRASEQDAVMTALARAADSDDDVNRFMARHNSGCLTLPLIPIEWSAISIDFIVGMSTTLVTGPLMGAMWKRRKLLADATAVQLTRNPDGLAAALEKLGMMPVRVHKASPVSHLFEVWRIGGRGAENDESSAATVTRYMNVDSARRLKQLRAMGAKVNLGMRKPSLLGGLLVVLLLGPFALVIGALLAVVFVLMMMLDVVFMAILLFALASLAHLLTVHWPEIRHFARQLIAKFAK